MSKSSNKSSQAEEVPQNFQDLFKRYFSSAGKQTGPVHFVLNAPSEASEVDGYINSIEKFLKDKSVLIKPGNNKDYSHASQITMTQLRRMYGDLKKINVKDRDDSDLLGEVKLKRVQMTYIAGRQEKKEAKFFCQLLLEAIKEMETKHHFASFMTFFEAVISFHKYHEKKK